MLQRMWKYHLLPKLLPSLLAASSSMILMEIQFMPTALALFSQKVIQREWTRVQAHPSTIWLELRKNMHHTGSRVVSISTPPLISSTPVFCANGNPKKVLVFYSLLYTASYLDWRCVDLLLGTSTIWASATRRAAYVVPAVRRVGA